MYQSIQAIVVDNQSVQYISTISNYTTSVNLTNKIFNILLTQKFLSLFTLLHKEIAMFTDLVSTIESFRGIDWFLLILLGLIVTLTPVAGFIEGFTSNEPSMSSYLANRWSTGVQEKTTWEDYGSFLSFSTIFIVSNIISGDEVLKNFPLHNEFVLLLFILMTALLFGALVLVIHILMVLHSITFGIVIKKMLRYCFDLVQEKYDNFIFASRRDFG